MSNTRETARQRKADQRAKEKMAATPAAANTLKAAVGKGYTGIWAAVQSTPQALNKFMGGLGPQSALINKTQNGFSPLYLACQFGPPQNVEMLIAHGADPNLRCGGVSPLHVCCVRGFTSGVKFLLEATPLPANPNLTSLVIGGIQQTPLQAAASCGQLEIVKLLLKAGGQINAVSAGLSALRLAVEHEAWEVAILLLETGADISIKDTHGNTLVHILREGNNPMQYHNQSHLTFADRLLKKGGDAQMTTLNTSGQTALHCVLRKGCGRLALLFLSYGAKVWQPSLLNRLDAYGCAPIHYACEYGLQAVVRRLIAIGGVDVNSIVGVGPAPPASGAAVGDKKAVAPGAAASTTPVLPHQASGMPDGSTPLTIALRYHCRASQRGDDAAQAGSDTKEEKKTPAPATPQKDAAAAAALAAAPGTEVKSADATATTPSKAAVIDLKSMGVSAADTNAAVAAVPPLATVTIGRGLSVAKVDRFLALHLAQALVEAGAHVDAVSEDETALLIAVSRKDTITARYLIERANASVLIANLDGMTPLHLVVDSGLTDVFTCVADRSSPVVNKPNNLGRTPLHLAIMHSAETLALYLIKLGADPSLTIDQGRRGGQSALSMASPEFRKVLEESVTAFQRGLLTQLDRKQFSDVRIICESGDEIAAHRPILAARCAFFKEMLLKEDAARPKDLPAAASSSLLPGGGEIADLAIPQSSFGTASYDIGSGSLDDNEIGSGSLDPLEEKEQKASAFSDPIGGLGLDSGDAPAAAKQDAAAAAEEEAKLPKRDPNAPISIGISSPQPQPKRVGGSHDFKSAVVTIQLGVPYAIALSLMHFIYSDTIVLPHQHNIRNKNHDVLSEAVIAQPTFTELSTAEEKALARKKVDAQHHQALILAHLGSQIGLQRIADLVRNRLSGELRDQRDASGTSNVAPSTFAFDMGALLRERLFCDLKIVLTDPHAHSHSSQSPSPERDSKHSSTAAPVSPASAAATEFMAHRLVLVSRSEYFKSMFETSMSESTEGVLRIDHVPSGVFSALLVFLYSGVVDVSSSSFNAETAAHLLDLSHQYMITELQRSCVYALRLAVQPSNCLDFYMIASRYQTASLEAAALKCIVGNFDSIPTSAIYRCPDHAIQEIIIRVLNESGKFGFELDTEKKRLMKQHEKQKSAADANAVERLVITSALKAFLHETNMSRQTPFQFCCAQRGYAQCLSYLLNCQATQSYRDELVATGANVSSKAPGGNTLPLLCAQSRNLESLIVLLDTLGMGWRTSASAATNDRAKESKSQPLLPTTVAELSSGIYSQIMAWENDIGDTVLSVTCRWGDQDMSLAIVENYPELLSQMNLKYMKRETPLDLAADPEFKQLLKSVADPKNRMSGLSSDWYREVNQPPAASDGDADADADADAAASAAAANANSVAKLDLTAITGRRIAYGSFIPTGLRPLLVFNVEGQPMYADAAVVAARSTVLREQMGLVPGTPAEDTEYKNAAGEIVVPETVTRPVFARFLSFLYDDTIPDLSADSDWIYDLLSVAVMFGVDHLQTAITTFQEQSSSSDSAAAESKNAPSYGIGSARCKQTLEITPHSIRSDMSLLVNNPAFADVVFVTVQSSKMKSAAAQTASPTADTKAATPPAAAAAAAATAAASPTSTVAVPPTVFVPNAPVVDGLIYAHSVALLERWPGLFDHLALRENRYSASARTVLSGPRKHLEEETGDGGGDGDDDTTEADAETKEEESEVDPVERMKEMRKKKVADKRAMEERLREREREARVKKAVEKKAKLEQAAKLAEEDALHRKRRFRFKRLNAEPNKPNMGGQNAIELFFRDRDEKGEEFGPLLYAGDEMYGHAGNQNVQSSLTSWSNSGTASRTEDPTVSRERLKVRRQMDVDGTPASHKFEPAPDLQYDDAVRNSLFFASPLISCPRGLRIVFRLSLGEIGTIFGSGAASIASAATATAIATAAAAAGSKGDSGLLALYIHERADVVLACLRFVYTGIADFTGAGVTGDQSSAEPRPQSHGRREFLLRMVWFARGTRLPELARRAELRLLCAEND